MVVNMWAGVLPGPDPHVVLFSTIDERERVIGPFSSDLEANRYIESAEGSADLERFDPQAVANPVRITRPPEVEA